MSLTNFNFVAKYDAIRKYRLSGLLAGTNGCVSYTSILVRQSLVLRNRTLVGSFMCVFYSVMCTV